MSDQELVEVWVYKDDLEEAMGHGHSFGVMVSREELDANPLDYDESKMVYLMLGSDEL